MNEKELDCCAVSCDKKIDALYWEEQYQAKATGWDLGSVSPAMQHYIDTLSDKNSRILIPGCGNSYEAEYLLKQGFTAITLIDIAPTLVADLKEKFKNNPAVRVILGDFFEHQGTYDYILEQTFFCALPPSMRQKYVWKMHKLLAKNGNLSGLLFNRTFTVGPPFGGSQAEYQLLFKGAFETLQMINEPNSIAPRLNTELFIELKKASGIAVNLYQFKGVTCSGCANNVTEKLLKLRGVLQVSMNTNYSEILLVSQKEIEVETLQQIISFDDKYHITKIKA